MSTVRVAKVAVDRVAFHSHNVRRDLGDLRPLAASIKRFGVMQPVIVEDYGDTLRLRAGHRRLAAARMAGLTRIPALIHSEALDDEEWLIQSVQENEMRRELDHEERARAIKTLREMDCTWEGIAQTFGVSIATIRVWAHGPHGETKIAQASSGQGKRRVVSSRDLRALCEAWMAVRDASTDQVLEAIQQFAESGAMEAAMPQRPRRIS